MMLTTSDQILQWLDDHSGFANASLSIAVDSVKREVVLLIEHRGSISLAGEEELVKFFPVTLSGVVVLSGELTSDQGLRVYNIYPLGEAPGLVFDIWGKGEISLACTSVFIDEVKEIKQIARAVLSTDTLGVKIQIDKTPDAGYWIKRLGDRGYQATYIGYFGNEISTDQIDGYAGLSIRPRYDGSSPLLGVKFSKVAHANGILEILLELQERRLQEFWKNLLRILSDMEVIEVRSGNVVFNGNEWILFLETAVLPDRLLRDDSRR